MMGSTLLVPIIGKIMDFSKGNISHSPTYSSMDYKNGMSVILISIAIAMLILCFMEDRYLESEEKTN
jgi:hypothetical protein